MELINRFIYDDFIRQLKPGRVLLLLGARRVGKTHFLRKVTASFPVAETLVFNGEDQQTIDSFNERSVANFKSILGQATYLVIDEAQQIPDIGLKLKLLVDELPHVHVVVTGSSMFELNNKLGEPLVGRLHVIQLFPFAQLEMMPYENSIQRAANLEKRLLFGAYPELEHLSGSTDKIDYLEGLVSSYLLKDILVFEGIKKADKIIDLLRLIALQIGCEVSIDELAKNLKGISRNTIESYLDLLFESSAIFSIN